MTGAGAPWTFDDIEAALDEPGAHYDEWHLAGIGAATSSDGIERGTAWIEQGATPDPELVAWIARLQYRDMISIREECVSLPGEGPWFDTPDAMRGVPL